MFQFIEDLFPGEADWVQWIENVMMDDPEEHKRPEGKIFDFPDQAIPAMRPMLILAHLRKVVLQDMAELITIKADPRCRYENHEIYREAPVFTSPDFREFCLALSNSMQTAKSPLTDSLAANAPAIDE